MAKNVAMQLIVTSFRFSHYIEIRTCNFI